MSADPHLMYRALRALSFDDLCRATERQEAYRRANVPLAARLEHDQRAFAQELVRRKLFAPLPLTIAAA